MTRAKRCVLNPMITVSHKLICMYVHPQKSKKHQSSEDEASDAGSDLGETVKKKKKLSQAQYIAVLEAENHCKEHNTACLKYENPHYQLLKPDLSAWALFMVRSHLLGSFIHIADHHLMIRRQDGSRLLSRLPGLPLGRLIPSQNQQRQRPLPGWMQLHMQDIPPVGIPPHTLHSPPTDLCLLHLWGQAGASIRLRHLEVHPLGTRMLPVLIHPKNPRISHSFHA